LGTQIDVGVERETDFSIKDTFGYQGSVYTYRKIVGKYKQ